MEKLPETLGNVIAYRLYGIENSPENARIEVFIGEPRQFSASLDYFTPFLIRGSGSGNVKRVGGVDSLQSLQLAISMISIDIAYLEESIGKNLVWTNNKENGLGF